MKWRGLHQDTFLCALLHFPSMWLGHVLILLCKKSMQDLLAWSNHFYYLPWLCGLTGLSWVVLLLHIILAEATIIWGLNWFAKSKLAHLYVWRLDKHVSKADAFYLFFIYLNWNTQTAGHLIFSLSLSLSLVPWSLLLSTWLLQQNFHGDSGLPKTQKQKPPSLLHT